MLADAVSRQWRQSWEAGGTATVCRGLWLITSLLQRDHNVQHLKVGYMTGCAFQSRFALS